MMQRASDLLDEAITYLKDRRNGIRHGLQTPYQSLNNLVEGLRPADLIVVAGRPSMGKTAFALSLACFAASSSPVLFFSLEMSAMQLVVRILQSATDKIEFENIIIDDTSVLDHLTVAERARAAHEEWGPISLVVVDYIQLMRGSGGESTREREIAQVSGALKGLAKELKIPVVALSQLNRGVEMRGNKRPMNSDLRESGAIEQDADTVLMLYRPEYYGDTKRPGECEIIISKQRNGPTGVVTLMFEKEFTRFSDRLF